MLLVDGTENRGKFNELKDVDSKYYCSDYYDVCVNKYSVRCGTSLRFWETNGWIK